MLLEPDGSSLTLLLTNQLRRTEMHGHSPTVLSDDLVDWTCIFHSDESLIEPAIEV
ncbi:hypothetical protein FHS27_001742 [Rhodopirellula rubra]|uniref:Uncharacterized protein n=1 Tax=Aporhodopirellula rubra TaxID=980271 RepID=A0A7W5DWP4_9BACT|nr:hypothetical protein [Aporhodopirellula rubra]